LPKSTSGDNPRHFSPCQKKNFIALLFNFALFVVLYQKILNNVFATHELLFSKNATLSKVALICLVNQ
jgi:hypothetical protein